MTDLAIAQNALNLVEDLAQRLGSAETLLESGYAQFAQALLDVQEGLYWQPEHESWGAYMKFVTEKFHIGQRQIYHKIAAVRELKGVVELDDLTTMGISKASALADIHRNTGVLPAGAIENAKDPNTTVKQLKQKMAEALHITQPEDGSWMDLGFAFLVSDDERAEINEAIQIARTMDPPVSNTLVEHQQAKEVCLRFVREFLATYAAPPDDESL